MNLSTGYTFTDRRLQLCEKIAKLSSKGECRCQNQMATKLPLQHGGVLNDSQIPIGGLIWQSNALSRLVTGTGRAKTFAD